MSNVLNVYKPEGITPVQLIEQLRINFPEYREAKISFAGRLDPLAHGVMVLLLGEENKQREKYLNLEKEYTFSCLLGVETDTFDYLGILKSERYSTSPEELDEEINKFLKYTI